MRHGPHHVAQKSTSTGLSALRTVVSNSLSVTSWMFDTCTSLFLLTQSLDSDFDSDFVSGLASLLASDLVSAADADPFPDAGLLEPL